MSTGTIDGKAAAANDRDLFGNPIEKPAPAEDKTSERERRANKPIQKLHRQIEQRVKEIRLWSMVGVNNDSEQDKRTAMERIRQLAYELNEYIEKTVPTL